MRLAAKVAVVTGAGSGIERALAQPRERAQAVRELLRMIGTPRVLETA